MPNGPVTYRRGEIRWVILDPRIGAEAKKTRSCLVVQNDIGNRLGLLTVVIPFLPGHKSAPYVVNVEANTKNGFDVDRHLDVGQIRPVDNQPILGLVRHLEERYWVRVQAALNIVIGFA